MFSLCNNGPQVLLTWKSRTQTNIHKAGLGCGRLQSYARHCSLKFTKSLQKDPPPAFRAHRWMDIYKTKKKKAPLPLPATSVASYCLKNITLYDNLYISRKRSISLPSTWMPQKWMQINSQANNMRLLPHVPNKCGAWKHNGISPNESGLFPLHRNNFQM